MIPDFTTMTVDAAVTLSTLLTVVFFAYLVETSRVGRERQVANLRWGTFGQVIGLLIVAGSISFGLLQLLAVINNEGVTGDRAVGAWFSAGATFVILIVTTVIYSVWGARASSAHAAAPSK